MQRRLLIASGIMVLFLIHTVAAFSLGVYIGRYGMTRDGLALGPQRQQPPGPPDQQPQLGPRLQGRPTFVGRIRRISPETLDLATTGGPHQVAFDETTELRDERGETIPWHDLEEGRIVAIFGDTGEDRQQLWAHVIVLVLDGPPQGVAPNQPRAPANP